MSGDTQASTPSSPTEQVVPAGISALEQLTGLRLPGLTSTGSRPRDQDVLILLDEGGDSGNPNEQIVLATNTDDQGAVLPNPALAMTPAEKTADLIQRVHDLPPELFDIVKDYTLTRLAREYVTIDASYTPPSELSVTNTTRDNFAFQFYRSTIFTIPCETWSDDLHLKWLASIPPHCRNLIRYLRFEQFGGVEINLEEAFNMLIRLAEGMFNRFGGYEAVWLHIMYMRVRVPRVEGRRHAYDVDARKVRVYDDKGKEIDDGGMVEEWEKMSGVRDLWTERLFLPRS